MGRPLCENFLILVKCPRDSRKKPDCFRCEKISLATGERSEWKSGFNRPKDIFRPVLFVLPLCARPMRKVSLATREKLEWKSGFKEVVVGERDWD